MKHKIVFKVLSIFFLSFVISCSSDDDRVIEQEELNEEVVEEEIEEEVETETPVETVYPLEGETGSVLLYDNSLSKEGYVLFNEATE
ncbi:MAG: hypothetical protein WBC58_17815, partial [Maribacter stanieri]